jgi:glucosamine 6-phosphate synthetase-like amidotransferase/phosphosugar isomerase protein
MGSLIVLSSNGLLLEKVLANLQEMRARGGKLFLFGNYVGYC